LVAFRLYCQLPFGKLDSRNPEIGALARLIGRTPSAVSMKACNFASLDPAHRARNVKGLGKVSAADRRLWAEFTQDSEALAAQAEAAYEQFTGVGPPPPADDDDVEPTHPTGPTEVERIIRTRRVQGFFRATVFNCYDSRCALTGLAVPALLNASHIIPWSDGPTRRADPRNGLCLNVLHDRAFDRGLVTFDEEWRLVISPQLRVRGETPALLHQTMLDLEGTQLRLPARFQPDAAAMGFHRERVFKAG